jgi:hypothetical protein
MLSAFNDILEEVSNALRLATKASRPRRGWRRRRSLGGRVATERVERPEGEVAYQVEVLRKEVKKSH